MKKALRIVLIVLLCGILAFSLYKVGSSLWGYHVGSSTYEDIADEFVKKTEKKEPSSGKTSEKESGEKESGETASESETAPAEEGEKPPIEVDFDKLLRSNKDVIGWLYSEDTPINYPVVKAADNEKYLRHLLNGKYNIAGTLFVDYRHEAPFEELNTFIYGHNLRDTKMFGTINRYQKEEYYKAHPVMWLLTPEADYKLSVIGGMETNAYSDFYDFDTDEAELATVLNTVTRKTKYTSDVDIESVEKIVTLSTCSYSYDDARYVLLLAIEKLG